MLEITISTAEEMESSLKSLKRSTSSPNSKKRSSSSSASTAAIEILERYRLQPVKIPEAEKLLEKVKLKEDALSILEKKLYASQTTPLSYNETLEITKELQILSSDFKGERMERLKQELFLKKILVLKDLWESNGQTEGSSFEHMKELEVEAKIKFSKRPEPRFTSGQAFLLEATTKCGERAKEISEILSSKELESLLKEDARFCGFVDMSTEIHARLAALKISHEK